jgi:GNAT superfamily N-acetyltransferase
MKIDFEIVPIFNQSANPRTWHDFTELEMKCDAEKYFYKVDDKDRNRIFKGHMCDWQKCKYNIAFAAYNGEQMLGFSTAYKESNSAVYLRNLYVDPKYNGIGIGRQLLDKTEKAAALIASSVNVIALAGALSFYESRGYISFDNRSLYKDVPKVSIGVVPVFQWYNKMRATPNVDVDKTLLQNCKYQPIFVYIGADSKIEGVAVRSQNGENVVWVNEHKGSQMAQFYNQQLLKALSKVR